jgi:hypothetical protein
MKIALLFIAITVACYGQTAPKPSAETKGACSPANAGDKNTFNITCGIGKAQGDQIIQILNKILSNQAATAKLDEILKQLQALPSATTVTSFNQQGGITAGQVNITSTNAVRIGFTPVTINERKEGAAVYESTWLVTLNGPVPELYISASSPVFSSMNIGAEHRVGMTTIGDGKMPTGEAFVFVREAYGDYFLTVRSTAPSGFIIGYSCGGVSCTGPIGPEK